MRKVIGGVAYDTETADEIAGDSHPHDTSYAWWRLYRTTTGVYFKVVFGHDGRLSSFIPLTDQQARQFLEANANSLVERYFGLVPEATRFLYSRRTIFSAIDVLEIKLTNDEISALFTDFGPEVYNELPDDGSAKIRMVALKRYIDTHQLTQVDDNILENVLVERAIQLLPRADATFPPWLTPPEPREEFARLQRSLSQDGFIVAQGELRRELPADVGLSTAEAELVRLLDRHSLTTAKGHLDQALKNHAAGNWASANSQIRAFFESLFDDLAVKLDNAAASKKSGHERRTHLANLSPPLFDRSLNEWGDNGVGFINGLMVRLHPHGSHPGLSDEEDSTFRLHIVLLVTRFFLARFDRAGN